MIAIVGAGITGLALAHELQRAGLEHLVLEASDRAGGMIRSERVEGRVLEMGPQRARMTKEMRRLMGELGLQAEVLIANPGLPLYVYSGRRLRRVPFSAAEFLRTDILGPAAKLRLLMEPFTRAADEEERVSAALTRKFGRRAYESMLGPLYGGLYGSDPADMVVGLSLAHALREFGAGRSLLLPLLMRGGGVSPPPAISFPDGLQALTDALHAAAAERVRLGAAVTGLQRGAAGGLIVTAGGDEIHADRVVVTTPAPQAAELLRGIDPATADRIAALHYNQLAVVHLSANVGISALGYQVALEEPLMTRGVTFNDSLFGRPGVYTAYLGGARAPEAADWADDLIADTAVHEFQRVTGSSASVISVSRVGMPAWDTTWISLRGLRLPDDVVIASNWIARPGIPGRLTQARRLAEHLASADPAGHA